MNDGIGAQIDHATRTIGDEFDGALFLSDGIGLKLAVLVHRRRLQSNRAAIRNELGAVVDGTGEGGGLDATAIERADITTAVDRDVISRQQRD